MRRVQTLPMLSSSVLVALLAGGCAPDAGGGGAAGLLSAPEATVAFDDRVSNVLVVEWDAGAPGRSWVEYALDDEEPAFTPVTRTDDGWSAQVVLGLKAGRTYVVRGVTELDDGTLVETEAETVSAPPRPAGLPALDPVIDELGEDAVPGFLLATILGQDQSWVVIVDREGDYLWWHDPGEGSLVPTVKLARNGRDILFASYDLAQQDDLAELHRVSLTEGELGRARTVLGHHDFAELPGGDLAWLAFETRTMMVDGAPRQVTGDALRVAGEGTVEGDPAPVIFSLLGELDEVRPACEHAADILPGTGGMDWSHANSLVYSERDDAFYFMTRHLDTLHKVAADTGELLLRMGPSDGPGGPGTPPLWSHPHFSQLDQDGLLLFDNGGHRAQQVSGLVHLELDEDQGIATPRWRFDDPDGRYIPALGDLRRLPGGTYLSSWMSAGMVREIGLDGEILWQLESEVGAGIGRIQWVPDLYRMASY